MARRIVTEELDALIAKELDLPEDQVRLAWRSQFLLVATIMAEGLYRAIRLPFFGRFYVKPGRLDHLAEAKENARLRRESKGE